jgi:hypothetical protein
MAHRLAVTKLLVPVTRLDGRMNRLLCQMIFFQTGEMLVVAAVLNVKLGKADMRPLRPLLLLTPL